MLLATAPWPIPFDLYLLRYREMAFVDWHIDPAPPNKKHYRLNVFLKEAENGGLFRIEGEPIWSSKRIQFFRPDKYMHKVCKVHKGTRYVLSLGWLW